MENKYYTPGLSEFHHGFEYEIKEMCSINKGPRQIQWNKNIVEGLGSTELHWRISSYPEEIRVKYLSKLDIEDCGFELAEKELGNYVVKDAIKYKNGDYYIVYMDGKLPFLGIFRNDKIRSIDADGNFKKRSVFEGNVKNKSELKKLLKQLGI